MTDHKTTRQRAARATLERTTFRTSRILDFVSEKELVAQIGHAREAWPIVILKELIDNAIDACEEAGIPPVVAVTVDDRGIIVEDNGPGLPADVIEDVLDFGVRVSSREAYVSPTRGAQGNALKTIVGMPFVLDGHRGRTVIEALGIQHTIELGVDRIRQQPTVDHRVEPGDVTTGTRVTVEWPDSGCSILAAAMPRFLQLAAAYTWLNPHLGLRVTTPEGVMRARSTDPAWTKWRPSDPTSAHWYAPAHFERLIAGYIAHDADRGRVRMVRELVTEFRGLSGTAKQKAVLEETGLWRAPLSALTNGTDLDHDAVARLLAAMKARSLPVKPAMLGTIGPDHLAARFAAYGCETASFDYRRVMDSTDGVPWIVETAFGWVPQVDQRLLITGVNWSPGILNPFRELGTVGHFGQSLDTILTRQRVDRDDPVILALHMACPRVRVHRSGQKRGGDPMNARKIIAAVEGVTAKWTKQRKAEERHAAAEGNRRDAMTRRRRVTIKDAAYDAMPAAYAKASANGTLPALARQIMYAARPTILARTGKEQLNDEYFTQQLLPNFMTEHPELTAGWNVVFDARGNFVEPHTEKRVPLGTLNVRDYLAEIRHHKVEAPDFDIWEARHPTVGPKDRFGAILFIEKEGFTPLLEAVQLAERHDLAIMSTKGMSVTASRELVERVCSLGVPLLVLHDFDKSGFSIVGTLRRSTRRHQFAPGHASRVIDLGLRLEDVDGLETEDVYFAPQSRAKVAANLRENGATEAEIAFSLKQRVELNAFASDELVAWIERKLLEHGVAKVVPDADALAKPGGGWPGRRWCRSGSTRCWPGSATLTGRPCPTTSRNRSARSWTRTRRSAGTQRFARSSTEQGEGFREHGQHGPGDAVDP